MMGSRTAANEQAAEWVAAAGSGASQGTFADATGFGDLLVNCTAGAGSLDALRSARPEDLAGKVLIDVANPLDFSQGMAPSLFVSNTDSLGEQIQRAFPETNVSLLLRTGFTAALILFGLNTRGSAFEETVRKGVIDEFRPRGEVELALDVLAVKLRRSDGDVQERSDLAVRVAEREQAKDISLAHRERCRATSHKVRIDRVARYRIRSIAGAGPVGTTGSLHCATW